MTIRCTILIPTKDRPNLLKRTIISALQVAPDDSEILIIDDKSNPPAQIVLAEFDNPRLVALVNEGSGGAAVSDWHWKQHQRNCDAMRRYRCVESCKPCNLQNAAGFFYQWQTGCVSMWLASIGLRTPLKPRRERL